MSRRWHMYIWIGSSLAIASALLFAAATDFEVEMGTEPTGKPWIMAIQPGLFEIKRLLGELAHKRGDTKTSYGPVREADINKSVFLSFKASTRIASSNPAPRDMLIKKAMTGKSTNRILNLLIFPRACKKSPIYDIKREKKEAEWTTQFDSMI